MVFLKKKDVKPIVENSEGEVVPLRKTLRSAGLDPIPYKHSDKFIKDGEDPLNFERERISHKNVDYLLKEQRVPAIEADTHLEIGLIKEQYSDHVYACRKVLDMEIGEIQRVLDMREAVKRELEEYEKLKEELLSNCKRYA